MESCVRILIRRVTSSDVSIKELTLSTMYWMGLGWKQEEQSESNVSSPWERLQRAELSMGRKRRRKRRTKNIEEKVYAEGDVWDSGLDDWLSCCCLSCSVVSDSFATPWIIACQAPLSIGSSMKEY